MGAPPLAPALQQIARGVTQKVAKGQSKMRSAKRLNKAELRDLSGASEVTHATDSYRRWTTIMFKFINPEFDEGVYRAKVAAILHARVTRYIQIDHFPERVLIEKQPKKAITVRARVYWGNDLGAIDDKGEPSGPVYMFERQLRLPL